MSAKCDAMNRLLKHTLIGLGILVVFTLGVVAWYWPTFSILLQNMGTMGEGTDAAQAMRHPDDLLAYIANHPEQGSLVVLDLNHPEAGLSYAPDMRRSVTGLPHLMTLAAYAGQVSTGQTDSDRPVPHAELEVYHLPGTDGGAHQRFTDSLRADPVTLDQVVKGFMQFNSPAAGDYVLHLLGREVMARQPDLLELAQSESPRPFSGQVLAWRSTADAPEDVYDWTQKLRTDATFRTEIQAQLGKAGTGLSLDAQRTLAQSTFPKGTASDYARLMTRMASDTTAAVWLMRTYMEQPLPGAEGQLIASKAGSFPGIISFAGYVRDDAGGSRVVVMLLDNLPMAVFYHLLQTGLDKGLVVQLLLDRPEG